MDDIISKQQKIVNVGIFLFQLNVFKSIFGKY